MLGDNDLQTESSPNTEAALEKLSEMFPQIPQTYIKQIADRSLTIDSVVESLSSFDSTENSLDITADISVFSLQDFLNSFQLQVVAEEIPITIERDNLWCSALKVYKSKFLNSQNLKKRLSLSFKDEDGLDAGAITKEFFQILLEEIKKRLFQGNTNKVVPIKDCTKLFLFQIAGIVISHSILQLGPSFPCLSPSVFYYLVGKIEEARFHLHKDDIPLTAATQPLLKLIEGLDNCATDETLDQLLDDAQNMQAISSAHWPIEVPITLNNKG